MEKRNYRLDILKTLSIIFVLLWHLQPFQIFQTKIISYGMFHNGFNLPSYIYLYQLLIGFFNMQILLLAVPTFILVSLDLFFEKLHSKDNYIIRRIIRLINIFIFWSSIQFLIFFLITHQFNTPTINTILNGGPNLPLVGGSVFYFLFDLLILTIFSYFYYKIPYNFKNIFNIFFITIFLIIIEINYIFYPNQINLIPFSFLRFLIYIPIAYLIIEYKNKFLSYKYIYLLLYFLFTIKEIYLTMFLNIKSIDPYYRTSIVFGTITLFCFISSLHNQKSNTVATISKYSLGLYAVHKYFQYISLLFIHNYLFFSINLKPILVFLSTLLLSVLSIYLLSKTKLKYFLS